MVNIKYTKLPAGEIKYLESGGETSKTILYLHGGFGSPNMIKIISNLFGNEYRIIAPFLPGHGSMDLDEKTTLYDLSELMAEFVIKLNLKSLILVGHSLGGRVALEISQDKRLEIKQLFLYAPLLKPLSGNRIICGLKVLRDLPLKLLFSSAYYHSNLPSLIKNRNYIWKLLTALPITALNNQPGCRVIWGKSDHVLPFAKYAALVSNHVDFIPGGHYSFFETKSRLTPRAFFSTN